MIYKLALLVRLLHIHWVLLQYGLDRIIVLIHLFAPLRFLFYLNPFYWLGWTKRYPRGIALVKALETLGPIFVKFGQALSVRRDLIPSDIADALASLQDRVPPFAGMQAKAIVEAALEQSVETLFAEFSLEPLASASIAQVHAASLPDGRQVVVKIKRPGIERMVARDLTLLKLLAQWTERYWRDAKQLQPTLVVDLFTKTLKQELDLINEAANAAQFRRNFKDAKQLYIPEIIWPYTRETVLVQERVHGTPIADMVMLRTQGVNMKRLAEIGIELFFTQVFRDRFFHADIHPGNIFVNHNDPNNPYYIMVDFGIMGTLNPNDQWYLAENFHAFFERDYHRIAMLHIESGWVPADTRVEEFEAAIRAVCEPLCDRPLREISAAQVLMRLFRTGQQFKMKLLPQFVLLQKTLFAIEGLGRQLYPELDLWQAGRPYLEQWAKSHASSKAMWRHLRRQLPQWIEEVIELPVLLHRYLKDKQHTATEITSLRKLNNELTCIWKYYYYLAGVVSTGLLGAVTWFIIRGVMRWD